MSFGGKPSIFRRSAVSLADELTYPSTQFCAAGISAVEVRCISSHLLQGWVPIPTIVSDMAGNDENASAESATTIRFMIPAP
jgi:hypothetical protein